MKRNYTVCKWKTNDWKVRHRSIETVVTISFQINFIMLKTCAWFMKARFVAIGFASLGKKCRNNPCAYCLSSLPLVSTLSSSLRFVWHLWMVLNSILSGVPHPLMSSTSKVLPEYVPRRPVDLSHTSTTSGYTDTEALTYADLTAGPGPSDTEVFKEKWIMGIKQRVKIINGFYFFVKYSLFKNSACFLFWPPSFILWSFLNDC